MKVSLLWFVGRFVGWLCWMAMFVVSINRCDWNNYHNKIPIKKVDPKLNTHSYTHIHTHRFEYIENPVMEQQQQQLTGKGRRQHFQCLKSTEKE